jgi:hypothetical protein
MNTTESPVTRLQPLGDPSAAVCVDGVCQVPQEQEQTEPEGAGE